MLPGYLIKYVGWLFCQISEAMFMAVIVGAIGMTLIGTMPDKVLGIVGVVPGTPVYAHARPYILIRAMTFIPAIIATVGFSVFRGYVCTCVKYDIFRLINTCMTFVVTPVTLRRSTLRST